MKDVLNTGMKPIFYVEKKIKLEINNQTTSHFKTILLKDDPIFKEMKVTDCI